MTEADRQLAGAVLMTGIPGAHLDSETRATLEEIRPSGVILFRRNIENLDQLRELTAELHSLPSRPLISIDHEGGRVVRVGEPFTNFPVARYVTDEGMALELGRAMGRELAAAGIDIDFAPVLDVDSNADNPIIGERAFSHSAQEVATLALAFARGMHSTGIVPCGKHFPGHGDTDRDSHLELPLVHKSRQELDRVELAPFRAAIAAKIPMLMTAHVVYTALDADRPATISPRIVRQLLREELKFGGVIVSDDLEMRAVADHNSVPDAAVASLGAGCDWALVCNDFANSIATSRRIGEAIAAGKLNKQELQKSHERIEALRVDRRDTTELPCRDHHALRDRILATQQA